MMTSVGIRLPPMLDPLADAARRAATPGATGTAPGVPERLQPNPTLRLDGATGVVVVEFRNLAGEVQGTVPTARQLAAYRASVVSGAPLPPGMPGSGPDRDPAADQPEQPGRA